MAKNTSKEEIAKRIKEVKANFSSKGSKEEIAKEIKEASKNNKEEENKIDNSKKENAVSIKEELLETELQERLNESQTRLNLEEEINQKKDMPDLDSLAYKNYPNSALEVTEMQKPENLASVLEEAPYLRGDIDEKPFEYIAEMKEPNESLYSNLTGTIQEEMTNQMGTTSLYQKKEEDEGNKLYFTS